MTQIHKFEAAGLGKAPFRCVGMVQRVGPIRSYINGCTVEVGAPGQPMGCCKFCGQGIKDCFIIRSADGREFDVGCDCVAKTGDAGMKKVTDKIVAGLRREQRHAREGVKLAELAALMADPNTRAVLAARPHPAGYVDRKTGAPLTAWDNAEWLDNCSGTAGRIRLLGALKIWLAA